MFGLGLPELIVILVILLLLFGAKRLPEISRSLGQSAKEMRRGLSDSDDTKSDQGTPKRD